MWMKDARFVILTQIAVIYNMPPLRASYESSQVAAIAALSVISICLRWH